MGSKRSMLKKVAGLWLVVIAVACGRWSVTPPPAPAPTALFDETLPRTIEEARMLRQSGNLDRYEQGLQALAKSADPTIRRRAESLLGLFLFDQKRFDDAIPRLERAAQDEGAIAPFLRLRLVEAETRRGNLEAAVCAAAQVIATAPNTSAATIARLRLPALYAQNGDQAAADAAYQQTLLISIDELTERDFVDLATLLEHAQWADLATGIRMRLLREYSEGRFTEKTFGQLASMIDSPIEQLTLEESVKLASDLARADRYEEALSLLKRIAGRFPDAATSDLYQKVRMRALFNSRNYAQLLDETAGTKLDDPSMILLRARAAWRDDRPNAFRTGLEEIEKRFPASHEAVEAKVLRAKYYITDEIDYASSIANLQKAIDAGAVGNDGENIWTLGWTYFLWGKYDEALRVFERYLSEYPDGDFKTNSMFWSAKIYDKRGQLADRDARLRQITVEYPYSYYSYRAREILGQPLLPPSEIANGMIFPDVEAQLASLNDPRFAAVRELISVDLLRDATREMKALAASYPDNLGVAFLLADVYVAGGEPFKANVILQRRFRQFVRHGGSNVPQRFWQILFPLNYWDTIKTEAEHRGLDPYLLASIIRQESGFEPTVVSNAGAVGLMQIMPNEAARIASAVGLEGMTRERLFDPEENVAVGAAEYAQKLSAMGSRPILAIAAYNAGDEAVGRWLAQEPVDDVDLFVEAIPYAETRLYVKSVTRNRFEYRRIYEGSTETQ